MPRTITISIGFFLTLVVVAVAGLSLAYMFRTYLMNPWTRDGQVRAQVIQITPRVSGPIVELPIKDNQFVRKGDLLLKIDPRTFEARVAQCKASLNKAKAAAAEAKDQLDRANHMYQLDKGSISRLMMVEKKNALLSCKAVVQGASADLLSARLDLEFTTVRAPADGYVTNLKLQPGSNTVANQPALALIDVSTFWVYGFFKETQIEHIFPGDRAVVKLMSYPDQPIEGRVESVGWGIARHNGSTGVDLLPTVNPSFDWIRLAQRIPVIVYLTTVPEGVALRVGTTATVIVLHPHEKLWGTKYLKQLAGKFDLGFASRD